MLYYLKLYLASFVAFLVIDGIWLGLVAGKLYSKYLGFILSPNPNWFAAGIFYLLFVVGLLVLVVVPGLEKRSLKATLLRAALFGLVTYATYDLTNLATIKDWPVLITVVDMLWGTVLSVGVSAISYAVGRRLR
ncbi:MAG: DUF2177 family protein [Anaerolineae bacterium]